MKPHSFDLQLSRNDYATGLAALMGELARLDDVRPKMLFARLAVTVAVVLAVLYFFPESSLALFTAIMLFWLADFSVQSFFGPRITGVSYEPAMHSGMRVTFDDEGVSEHVATRSRRWAWDSVRRVHAPAGYVVIEFAGWDMVILPDSSWSGPEERSAFLAELAERRPATHFVSAGESRSEAEARMFAVEPVLLARIALTVAAFELGFEAQFRLAGPPAGTSAVAILLAIASLAGAFAWWGSGRGFEALAERSPLAAKRTASGLFALLAVLFALWYLRLI